MHIAHENACYWSRIEPNELLHSMHKHTRFRSIHENATIKGHTHAISYCMLMLQCYSCHRSAPGGPAPSLSHEVLVSLVPCYQHHCIANYYYVTEPGKLLHSLQEHTSLHFIHKNTCIGRDTWACARAA